MSMRKLSPKLQEIAQKEINEDPNKVSQYLKNIDEWLMAQSHLNVRKDLQFLLTFLRVSKFNLEQTKERLDFFYTVKTLTPEYFLDRDHNRREIREILDKGAIIPITKHTEAEGIPTIVLVKWSKLNPESDHFTDLVKLALMGIEVTINEHDNSMINGINIVHDMKGFSLGYLKQLTPLLCKKLILVLQNAYPLRLQGIHFINTPTAYETFIDMFTPFFNEEFASKLRIFREDAIEEFYKHIPRTVLPEEYGGSAGPISKIIAEFNTLLDKYKKWFVDDAKYGSDESKRPGKPKTSVDIFGMEECSGVLNID